MFVYVEKGDEGSRMKMADEQIEEILPQRRILLLSI
jgi:hypothetical protein